MFGSNAPEIDLSQWKEWIAPVAGLGAAIVVLLAGLLLFGRRKRVRPIMPPLPAHTADPFLHGSAAERRSSLRRGGNPVAVLISDARARSEPVPGWVVDRSTGGLCLSVSDKLTPGTVLSVRTANAPEAIPWVQVEVKNCREAGSAYEVGCQFVRTPPWSVMLLFG
jgi:hypothetical protein